MRKKHGSWRGGGRRRGIIKMGLCLQQEAFCNLRDESKDGGGGSGDRNLCSVPILGDEVGSLMLNHKKQILFYDSMIYSWSCF